MIGPVSVIDNGSEDGSNVQLQQNISWQPPVSGEVMMYLVRYGMGVSNLGDASFNVTTQNTFTVLTLSLATGHPDVVVYNIWVAAVTESQEKGNPTALIIQYNSE